MNLSQDLAVCGHDFVEITRVSKEIQDKVKEPGIPVNEITKHSFGVVRLDWGSRRNHVGQ